MLARTHLLRIQRSMYDRLKEHARDLLGGLSPELRRYFNEYQRDFSDFKEISTKQELLTALQRSQVVFCGDYHTLSQAQRTVIRLLREALPRLERQKRAVILALEMVRPGDQRFVHEFLAGKISEIEFLRGISFHRQWGFHWENYRSLFLFAREHQLKIVGLNSPKKNRIPTLKGRDQAAAKIIARLSETHPKSQIFCLMGDLHLAQAHLPRYVHEAFKKKKLARRLLVIHQNNERFYWKLVERKLEQRVEVLKMKDNIFCVMNTPPWVKLQSHVKWAELLSESQTRGAVFSVSRPQQASALPDGFDEIDYSDEVRELLQMIAQFIQLPSPPEDNFSIHGPQDLGFLGRLKREHLFPSKERRIIERALTEFKSHFIPRTNVLFFTSLSINHTATQSALFLHSALSGFDRVFTNPKQDFYVFVWVEALGFLGSKIINHKRKCNGPKDLARVVNQGLPRRPTRTQVTNFEIAQFVLDHLKRETSAEEEKKPLSPPPLPGPSAQIDSVFFYYKVAKVLGQLLGQGLYLAVVDEKVTRHELSDLFRSPWHSFSAPRVRELYMTWIRRLDRSGYRSKVKAERL
jgi:uncharacterized iron-regulated protein